MVAVLSVVTGSYDFQVVVFVRLVSVIAEMLVGYEHWIAEIAVVLETVKDQVF